MRIRPFRESDSSYIGQWIEDERQHALWCANQLPFGFSGQEFTQDVRKGEEQGSSSFTAVREDGEPVGYFYLNIRNEDSYGFMGKIIVDSRERGKGYGRQMMELAVRYAFELADLDRLELMVFEENAAARALYGKIGFREAEYQPESFPLGEEKLGRYKLRLDRTMTVNGTPYRFLSLLGKGKGGYSYLVTDGGEQYVLKQLHHEPCDYYQFGDKLEAEERDYKRLVKAGVPLPRLLATDRQQERILKEYIPGPTVYELVRRGEDVDIYAEQVREMCPLLRENGLNIDYFPTNFVIRGGRLWYVDYECNEYSEEWSFERWGVKYWALTPEFLEYERSKRV